MPATAGADPLESLKTFSAFASVDLRSLLSGEILGEPGSPMSFPTGISAETVVYRRFDFADQDVVFRGDPAPYVQITCQLRF